MFIQRFILAAFIVIASATTSITYSKSININGIVKGNIKESKIYIFSSYINYYYKYDSVNIKENSFQFNIKSIERGFYKIGFSKENAQSLILSDENINVEIDANISPYTYKIINSNENLIFADFMQFIELNNEEINKYNQKSNLFTQDLRKKNEQKVDSLYKLRTIYLQNLVANLPNSFMKKYSDFYSQLERISKNYFLSQVKIDNELLHGSMYYDLVSTYLNTYYKNSEKLIKSECESIVNSAKDKASKEAMLISVCSYLASNKSTNKFIPYFSSLYKSEYSTSKHYNNLMQSLPFIAPTTGDEAPDFTLTGIDGKTYSLSDLKGKVVLLDFWASWCGPCRKENPNVVETYKKYKNKGFTVFSVSLDKGKDSWEKAIKADGLEWPYHVSELKGWTSKPGKLYGVSSIPNTWLIDKNGKIAAKNIRGHQLEKEVVKLLEN